MSASRRADVFGRALAYLERGTGGALPLVLLHGIGSTAGSFAAQLDAFGGERRVLAWNAPGYADSVRLDEVRPGPDRYAAALGGWLDAVGVDRCVLLGHSLGALMAMRFALRNPARVAHLVLSSPAQGYGCTPDGPLPAGLQARIDDVTTLGPAGMAARRSARTVAEDATPEILAAAREGMARVTVDGYAQAVWCLAQGTLVADATDFVAARPSALTLFCGTADRVTPFDGVRRFAAATGCTDLRPIAEAGHAAYLDHAAAYNAHLREVLDAVAA